MNNSIIVVPNMKVKGITTVRRTIYEMNHDTYPEALNKENRTVIVDETYDFTNPKHRKDILRMMAKDIFNTSSCFDKDVMDVITKEVTTVIHEIWNELPFL